MKKEKVITTATTTTTTKKERNVNFHFVLPAISTFLFLYKSISPEIFLKNSYFFVSQFYPYEFYSIEPQSSSQ